MTKQDKVVSGVYLILQHYSEGKFPPRFEDQQKVYDLERSIIARPNVADEMVRDDGRRKPLWYNRMSPNYLRDFALLVDSMRSLGIPNDAKVLEIGCGVGWASNFLAQMRFQVVGTTINPRDVEDARIHAATFPMRGLNNPAKFIEVPMENVNAATKEDGPFDVAFVYEALHHAYDWQIACKQVYDSLKPGGWFLLCNEPNLIHTAVAYRHSQMAHSPEIGFTKRKLLRGLKKCGFRNPKFLANRLGFYIRPIWLAVQRPS